MKAIYQSSNNFGLSPSGEFSTRRVLFIQDIQEDSSGRSKVFDSRPTGFEDKLETLLSEGGFSSLVSINGTEGLLNRINESRATMLVLSLDMLTPSIIKQLLHINQLGPLTVVVFVSRHCRRSAAKLSEAGVDSYNVDASRSIYDDKGLAAIFDVAQQRFAYETELKTGLTQIQKKLDDRKVIERAKGIIMQQFNMSEGQAYGHMRGSAMNQSCTVADLAARLINVAELSEVS